MRFFLLLICFSVALVIATEQNSTTNHKEVEEHEHEHEVGDEELEEGNIAGGNATTEEPDYEELEGEEIDAGDNTTEGTDYEELEGEEIDTGDNTTEEEVTDYEELEGEEIDAGGNATTEGIAEDEEPEAGDEDESKSEDTGKGKSDECSEDVAINCLAIPLIYAEDPCEPLMNSYKCLKEYADNCLEGSRREAFEDELKQARNSIEESCSLDDETKEGEAEVKKVDEEKKEEDVDEEEEDDEEDEDEEEICSDDVQAACVAILDLRVDDPCEAAVDAYKCLQKYADTCLEGDRRKAFDRELQMARSMIGYGCEIADDIEDDDNNEDDDDDDDDNDDDDDDNDDDDDEEEEED